MKTMKNSKHDITDSNASHNTLYSDYKAEVVAHNLLKYYEKVDQIFLKRLGSNNRPFNKDIKSISSQVYELEESVLSIATYREGLYDYLPEGVFHPPSLGNRKMLIDEIIAQMQQQKKIEADARKFFQPFELEPFFLELSALAKVNEFEITEDSELLLNIVRKLWPLLNKLDNDTSKTFIYLLPFFYTVRGNKKWFEKLLMAFLKIPVQISFTPNYVNDIKEASDSISLSNYQLGGSMVLSGEHMNGERNWAVHYGLIPYSDIDKYVPLSDLRNLLEILYNYCLPANVEVEEYFKTEGTDQSFILDEKGNTSILGYSTFS